MYHITTSSTQHAKQASWTIPSVKITWFDTTTGKKEQWVVAEFISSGAKRAFMRALRGQMTPRIANYYRPDEVPERISVRNSEQVIDLLKRMRDTPQFTVRAVTYVLHIKSH